MAEENGAARRWEAYAIKILSALIGVLSILFWDMRQDVIAVRRVQDQNMALIRQVEMMLKSDQEQIVHLAVIDKQFISIQDMLNIHTQRLNGIERRIDQIPNERLSTPEYPR